MSYLIENPLIVLFIVLLTGVVVFAGTKIYNEIVLNKMLKHKQASMRVGNINPGFNKRIGILGSTVLAPLFVIALILITGTNNEIINTGNLAAINNSKDVISIYETFSDKMETNYRFSGIFTKNFDIDEITNDSMILEERSTVTYGFSGSDYLNSALGDSEQGNDDYSETNNQVLGVDEIDNVVTDGKYIYTIAEDTVVITLAYTVGLEEEALSSYKTLDFLQNNPDDCTNTTSITGMYVDDDYLVVLGSKNNSYCDEDGETLITNIFIDNWGGYYQQKDSSVYVFDKTEDFSLISEYEVSGDMIGTRKIDDNLYIVTTTYLPFEEEDFDVDEYLPYYMIGENKVETDYEDITYIEGVRPNAFTAFYALDLDHEQVDLEVVLGDAGYNLYVSDNNIYLVGGIYYFSPLVDFIETDDQVSERKTAIMKVAINGASLEYVTTGVIAGTTLNQFSMDEYDGNLRIATTTGSGSLINNRVFILDENLEKVSILENIGKEGEQIKSVRFTGGYGYIVTFRQTDPFYVLNLSDPYNPVKEGELEIPGFSTYLQPLGEDFMLGIGFGDSYGGTRGIKISIYDIRDKSNPVVFDEVIFDYSEFGHASTSVTYNHKDLLVSLSKGLIALPFNSYSKNDDGDREYNSGILVYNFNGVDGLTYKGFVQHEESSTENIYVYKSKFISEFFYTISNKYIKVSTIEDPETILNEVLLIDEE